MKASILRPTMLTREYYALAKPGMVYGNAIPFAGGFLLATNGFVDLSAFAGGLAGLSLVIASGCVCNNYTDRSIDAKMERTKGRALVKGVVSGRAALTYASILGVLGLALLATTTNVRTVLVAALGFVAYVVLYALAKRSTVHSTLVGSIAGAVPPVAGYLAAGGTFDVGAALLFLLLAAWQLAHFYAIAIYRMRDYATAGIPVRSVVKGIPNTKRHMLASIAGFGCLLVWLGKSDLMGYIALLPTALLTLAWFVFGLYGLRTDNDERWARKMFVLSLVVLFALFVSIALNAAF